MLVAMHLGARAKRLNDRLGRRLRNDLIVLAIKKEYRRRLIEMLRRMPRLVHQVDETINGIRTRLVLKERIARQRAQHRDVVGWPDLQTFGRDVEPRSTMGREP